MLPSTIKKLQEISRNNIKAHLNSIKIRSKKFRVRRTPLPPSLREVMQKRKNKPIRIVFVCEQGMVNSPMVMEHFKSFLEQIHIDPKKVFSMGVDSQFLENSKSNLGRIDYFIHTLPHLTINLRKQNPAVFKKLKKSSAGIIFPDKMAATVGRNGELEYFDLLKEIIARERAKR